MKRSKVSKVKLIGLPRECLRYIFLFLTPHDYYTKVVLTCKAFDFYYDSILLDNYAKMYNISNLRSNLITISKDSIKCIDICNKIAINSDVLMKSTLLYKKFRHFIELAQKQLACGMILRSSLNGAPLPRLIEHKLLEENIYYRNRDSLIESIHRELVSIGNCKEILTRFNKYLVRLGYHNSSIQKTKNLFCLTVFWKCSKHKNYFFGL